VTFNYTNHPIFCICRHSYLRNRWRQKFQIRYTSWS